MAHLDTTARSMERKERVLFKESLCIVNRIKGDGESHLSLSLMSPGHSCVASTGEKGFHIPCSQKPSWGIFSTTQSADPMCIQQQLSNRIAAPHCPPVLCEAWQHPRESWILLTGCPLLCLHHVPSQPWHLGFSPKMLMLCLISDPSNVPVWLNVIPSGTETLSPPPSFSPPPSRFGALLACFADTNNCGLQNKGVPNPRAFRPRETFG